MNAKMVAMWFQGYSVEFIARSFGTTIKDVQETLRYMGVES